MPRSLYPRSQMRGRTVFRAVLESSLTPSIGPAPTFSRASVAYKDELLGGLQGNVTRLTEVASGEPRFCSRRGYRGAFGDGTLDNGFAWSEDISKNAFFVPLECSYTPDVIAGPGGVRTAGALIGSANDSYHIVAIDLHPSSAQEHGFSAYVKPTTHPYVVLASYNIDATHVAAFFDATTGALVNTDGPVVATHSEVIGSGWLRLQIRYAGGTDQHTHFVFPHNASTITPTSFTGDGSTPDLYIWGAQHSYGTDDLGGSGMPEYVATHGAARRLGPRFVGAQLEDESTNYVTGGALAGSPTRMTSPEYYLSDCAPSTTAVLCPDGVTRTTSMIAVVASPVDAYQLSYQSCIPGSTNCVSLYVRTVTVPWIQLFIEGPNASIWFDLARAVVGTMAGPAPTAVDILDAGAGWRRIFVAIPNPGSSQGHYFALRPADGVGNSIGLPAGDACAFWGHQFERDRTHPSSVILTSGASTTRPEDSLSYTGLTVSPGRRVRLKADVLLDRRDLGSDATVAALSDGGSAADQIALQVLAAGDAPKAVSASTGGDAGAVTGTTDVVDGVGHVIQADARTGSLLLRVDGALEGTEDSSVTLPVALDTLSISQPGGLVRDVKVVVG